jgi:hypothetical protein
MATIDDEELTKAIKDKIGGGEMDIFIKDTISTAICEMFEKLKNQKDFQDSIKSGIILLANNAIKTHNLGGDTKGGKRRTRKLNRL